MQLKKALVTELWYASKSANPPSASVVAASGSLPRTTSEVKWWPCWSTLADRCGVSSLVSSCADDIALAYSVGAQAGECGQRHRGLRADSAATAFLSLSLAPKSVLGWHV